MKTLGCQTKDNDLHMAAHNKLLKIFIQAPIRSDERKGDTEGRGPTRRLLTGMV